MALPTDNRPLPPEPEAGAAAPSAVSLWAAIGAGSAYKPGTDRVAIAAFVLAICGLVPISLVLAVVSLVAHRRKVQRGMGLAVAALIIDVIVGVLALLIATSAIGNPFATSGPAPRPSPTSEYLFFTSLLPGDCVPVVSEGRTPSRVRVLTCDQPHRGEVVAVFTLPAGPYPGEDEVMVLAEGGCLDRLEAYAPGSSDDPLVTLMYYYPTVSSWTDTHTVVCFALAEDYHTGSIKR